MYSCNSTTWLQRVLNVEHRGPVSIHHVLLNLVFGNVAAAIFYPDARFQVVEVAAVELEEFNEQNAEVDVGTGHVLPVMKLKDPAKLKHLIIDQRVTGEFKCQLYVTLTKIF